MKVIKHVPLSLAQGGPLLEYVSKDPDALTAALVTRWSPGHPPISASRLRSLVFRGLYTAREKPPAIKTDVPPEIQSQKVSHKIHKPISQFLAPHPRPSWDRLRTREVVVAFWALPNDLYAVLQAAQIQTAELIPLKFGLLAWASSVCLAGQYTSAPVATPPSPRQQGHVGPPPAAAAAGVLSRAGPQRGAAQPDRAGRGALVGHSPHRRPLQAGIPDAASLPPLTPPSHVPYLAKGHPAPSAVGTLFASAAFTPASTLYRSQGEAAPAGSDQSPSSLLHEQPRLSFSLPEPASQFKPAAADPTPPQSPAPTAGSPPPPPPAPRSQGSPLSRTWTCRLTQPTTPSCVTGMRPFNRS